MNDRLDKQDLDEHAVLHHDWNLVAEPDDEDRPLADYGPDTGAGQQIILIVLSMIVCLVVGYLTGRYL